MIVGSEALLAQISERVRPYRARRTPGQEGARNHRAKLTLADVLTIRSEVGAEPDRGVQRELARRFGVHESCISKIVNRQAWRSAP